ncbi:unnamed protein product [Gongylonema pulchrum]|uniref:Uncharacterized protein n=1 Tax=Gongylonema pulchrum TaxID=637853 RepID=A0A183DDY5_9BILA|nr:unnamed protein product [Gongylonema pulchrum]
MSDLIKKSKTTNAAALAAVDSLNASDSVKNILRKIVSVVNDYKLSSDEQNEQIDGILDGLSEQEQEEVDSSIEMLKLCELLCINES